METVLIDTNILVQYIARTDAKSCLLISEFIKKYDKFVITENVFIEALFTLQNKVNMTRDQIDEEIFCLMENSLFVFNISFDVYLFLNLYTHYPSLDVVDVYLLIQSVNERVVTLDMDLDKKIKTVKV